MDIVFGFHAVAERLQTSPKKVRRLLLSKSRNDHRVRELADTAHGAGIRTVRVGEPTLNRLSQGARHQGVLLECHAFEPDDEKSLEQRWQLMKEPFILVLDGVLDPGNLGAALRTSAAAGVDVVLFPKNRSAPLSAAVHKAASGGLEKLFLVQVSNLARRLRWLRDQGVWIVGTAAEAPIAYADARLTRPLALVIGGEERGMRRLTREACDEVVKIPMAEGMESLNVSVATGIMLFEARRQWLEKS